MLEKKIRILDWAGLNETRFKLELLLELISRDLTRTELSSVCDNLRLFSQFTTLF